MTRSSGRPILIALGLLLVGLLLVTAPVHAQTDVAGEWAVSFTTPAGPVEFTMFVAQEGTRLSGRLTSDAGEFPLRGTATADSFTITWSFPDQGKILEITFSGKIDGDSMNGTAKLGNSGTGSLSGQRTGR